MTEQPIIAKIFPNESYSSADIYEIAQENNLLVEDTPISDSLHILEIVACFHERNESDVCLETWKDDEHETICEFRSEDGQETYRKVS